MDEQPLPLGPLAPQVEPSDENGVASVETQTPDEAAALRQQLQEAQQREAETNRRLDQERQRIDSLLSQPRTPELPTAQDISSIPDPVEDADAFRTYMAAQQKRQQEEFDRRLEEQRQATEQSQQANMLWSLFQQRYPSYGNLFDLARQAFQDVTAGGAVHDTDQLLSAVKQRMDTLRGGAIENPTPAPANRTAGTSGGSTPKPASPAKSEEPAEDVSLSDAITDWQIEAGLI